MVIPPWIKPPSPLHRAVEILAVEAVAVDIMEEIGGGDRRSAAIEGDDDTAKAGVDGDGNQSSCDAGVWIAGAACRDRGSG